MFTNQSLTNLVGQAEVAVALEKSARVTIEVRKACQLQLGQLAAQLPIALAWMVYQTPKRDRCELRLLCTKPLPDLDHQVLAHLESEAWLPDCLPNLNVQALVIANHFIYVCPLRKWGTQPSYLLLWMQAPLTELQRKFIEQQAQLLSYWLAVDHELFRQQGEIQLLEQVVQKAEHQLRNPLALISLHAENLRLGLPAGVFHDQAVVIRDTVSDLSTSLTELLHCSQRHRLSLDRHDLRSLLLETLNALQPWLTEKQLQVQLPEQSLTLVIDGWQIKQVLTNLLHNAIHFSPQAGLITCDWQILGQEVQITVRDRGTGLSDEDLQHALTPYYSRRLGGTGLGLAIAHKIILDHRGNLWATNHPKGGAEFFLTLPLHQS
jgi:signal transduction histidine kinase